MLRAKERAPPRCLLVRIEGDNMKTTMSKWATNAAGTCPIDGSAYDTRGGYTTGYANGSGRGVVGRTASRDGPLRVREERSGPIITADMAGGRYGRSELRGLRRGDFVELSGQWIRGGV